MNDGDASRQIQQMIEFIKQEAREKAEEIALKAEAEFNAKKLNQIAHARMELKEEYEKKKKDEQAKKRISRSRTINNARFQQMRARDSILLELQRECRDKLAEVSKHARYNEVVRALLVESMIMLTEKDLEVRCREVDVPVVKKELPNAVKAFKALVKEAVGKEPPIDVKLDTTRFLSPPPSADNNGVSCLGGVVVTARGGKILCSNTLDSRFKNVFHDLLPVVREIIFGRLTAINK